MLENVQLHTTNHYTLIKDSKKDNHKKLLQTAVQINKVRINFFDIFQRILLG